MQNNKLQGYLFITGYFWKTQNIILSYQISLTRLLDGECKCHKRTDKFKVMARVKLDVICLLK